MTPESYWSDARRPLNSLLFLAPWLLIYEISLASIPQPSMGAWRNGADMWLRESLLAAGLGWHWLPPVLLVLVLMAWQWCGQFSWKISWETLWGMGAESSLFAFLLILFGQAWQATTRHVSLDHGLWLETSTTATLAAAWPRFINFLGAGIYEEFLFRLVAIPLLVGGLWLLRTPRYPAAATSLLGASLVFSLAHYLRVDADWSIAAFIDAAQHVQQNPSLWAGFFFRATAGVLFGLLFLLRGFGIAAGAHAIYDIVVGILMAETL